MMFLHLLKIFKLDIFSEITLLIHIFFTNKIIQNFLFNLLKKNICFI
jgi:hypothetical protein